MSESPISQNSAPQIRARVFYYWKRPEEKERHGFAMGVVTVIEKTETAVIEALRRTYARLEGFDVRIEKLEWR